MAIYVALLRGINVGAHKRIKMEALRKVFSDLDLKGAQTYLQSGNVVFKSSESNMAELATRIEAGIEHAFGFHSRVILRTVAELRNAAGANPFAGRKDVEPAKLIFLFLENSLSASEAAELREMDSSPDEVSPGEREVYIYYPDGMGTSKLNLAMPESLKTHATARNWRSVTGILAMMAEMDSGNVTI